MLSVICNQYKLQRPKDESDVTGFGNFDNSTYKRVGTG